MTNEEAKIAKNKILSENKILYCMKDRPATETTMCWGLEINNGWLNIVDEMSKQLEALNYMFYPKFRVRIQMDQVKEKFGLLTVYYSIVSDPFRWMCIWKKCMNKVFDMISRLDFKKLAVLDRDEYNEIVEEEIFSKEQFEKEKKQYIRCENVDVFERDGKYIKKSTFHHCRQTHYIPTKHRFLFKILQIRHIIENMPMKMLNVMPSHKQRCIEELLDDKAYAIVKKAEDACYDVCELCGHHIADDNEYSPRCITQGWIQYLCKDCADKSNNKYVMNGAVWRAGKEIVSKEERAKDIAEINRKLKSEGDIDEDTK